MKFVKYENFWWEYDETTPKNNAKLINLVGGYNTGNDITNCEIVEADGFECLDWSNTEILNKNSRYGWLDRNGKFYGCDYRHHDMQANYIHKKSRRELERFGWILIGKNFYEETGKLIAMFYGDYKEGVMPTDAQLEYLSRRSDVDSSFVIYAYKNGNFEKARIYEQKEKNQSDGKSL